MLVVLMMHGDVCDDIVILDSNSSPIVIMQDPDYIGAETGNGIYIALSVNK